MINIIQHETKIKPIINTMNVTITIILTIICIAFAFGLLYNFYKLRSFGNLATITNDGLKETLKCTGDKASQEEAFLALSRHTQLKHQCGQVHVNYRCWSDTFDKQSTSFFQKIKDLYFLANWCNVYN